MSNSPDALALGETEAAGRVARYIENGFAVEFTRPGSDKLIAAQ